ncbi:hypothetical protein RV03_GL003497 [Enterococcus gallinarum]|nr:hypothetical protein RV03_GL003497 [Enterococcus gallinarum]
MDEKSSTFLFGARKFLTTFPEKTVCFGKVVKNWRSGASAL